MMNPLTKRARFNHKAEQLQNYIIAALCGAIIGAMFALAI